eukprot:TRINITY_DN3411_c0_g1_i1.p1 TRINITY_DN3411_c0_g1~~TRINITY_DN3411_c0_g1_i1.p1  ORF type:complete len:103 (+),score=22.42 TRINITY_DN3411_c0_g1_i1:246-554(+)
MIIRHQVFGVLQKTIWPGLPKVLGLNTAIIGSSLLFAIFYPKIGDLLRYSGSLSGAAYIFVLPVLVHLKANGDGMGSFSKAMHYLIMVFGVCLFLAQFIFLQ